MESLPELLSQIKAAHFARYGEARHWLTDIAAHLNVGTRTVGYWSDGRRFAQQDQMDLLQRIYAGLVAGKAIRRWPEYDIGKLDQMREFGIKWVSIMGCNDPQRDCETCLAMKGQKIEIEFAPDLPLADCQSIICNCTILAEK